MKVVSLSLTPILMNAMDDLVKKGEFESKSQLIRYAISEYIKEDIELMKELKKI